MQDNKTVNRLMTRVSEYEGGGWHGDHEYVVALFRCEEPALSAVTRSSSRDLVKYFQLCPLSSSSVFPLHSTKKHRSLETWIIRNVPL